jgi:hypothetical protein
MENEPERPQSKRPAPPRNVRLAWWFVIYLAGSAPIVVKTLLGQNNMPWAGFFLWPIILPGAMFGLAGYAFYAMHMWATLITGSRRQFEILLIVLVLLVLINQAILADLANHMRV